MDNIGRECKSKIRKKDVELLSKLQNFNDFSCNKSEKKVSTIYHLL